MTPRFAANLVALLVVGVGALAWILHYTDWYPAVGGILALGGALSWLAFVSRILKEERVAQLQDWADAHLFGNPRTVWFAAGLMVVGLVAACFVGTLELQSNLGGSPSRTVSLRGPGSTEVTTEPLGATRRLPLWTTAWSPRRVRVKLGGVPEIEATVSPWQRTRLVAPDDFLRPVVLLRPDPVLLDMVANNPHPLVIRVASADRASEATVPDYRGEAVWVGCDEDVDVPDRLLDVWRTRLVAQGRTSLFHLWNRPIAPPGDVMPVASGDKVDVRVKGLEGDLASTELVVRPLRSERDFPQEEEIHAR